MSRSPTPFGQHLKFWRQQRGLSQLQLAHRAETTPRHLSFLETGRSRPGRALVLRLAESLELRIRDSNALLAAAGLQPAYPERPLEADELQPYRRAIETILQRHDPYPGCALDGYGQVRLANHTCRAMYPGIEARTAEESLDAFLGPGPGRQLVANWAEVAWAALDRLRLELARTHDPRLQALVERGTAHLEGVPRPASLPANPPPALGVKMRVGERIIETFTTVLRFDTAREVTLSELRVELVFPADDAGDAFFRGLADVGAR